MSTHDRHHRITGDHLKIAVKTAKDLNMRNAENIVGPSDLPLLNKDVRGRVGRSLPPSVVVRVR